MWSRDRRLPKGVSGAGDRQGLGPIGSPTCEPKKARFGGREVLDVVDLPDPTPGYGEQRHEVSAALAAP